MFTHRYSSKSWLRGSYFVDEKNPRVCIQEGTGVAYYRNPDQSSWMELWDSRGIKCELLAVDLENK